MEYTAEGFAFALKLSQLRSFYQVGMALSEAFPTEEAFSEYMQDPETIETLNIVSEILDEATESEDSEADALDKHRGRAIEALEPFAERIGANPDDLLVTLVA